MSENKRRKYGRQPDGSFAHPISQTTSILSLAGRESLRAALILEADDRSAAKEVRGKKA